MALKKPEVELLKEIIIGLHNYREKTRFPDGIVFTSENYPLDIIINGTDEEKLQLIKTYILELKKPSLQIQIDQYTAAASKATNTQEELTAVQAIQDAIDNINP